MSLVWGWHQQLFFFYIFGSPLCFNWSLNPYNCAHLQPGPQTRIKTLSAKSQRFTQPQYKCTAWMKTHLQSLSCQASFFTYDLIPAHDEISGGLRSDRAHSSRRGSLLLPCGGEWREPQNLSNPKIQPNIILGIAVFVILVFTCTGQLRHSLWLERR